MHYIPHITVLLLFCTIACLASWVEHICDFDTNTVTLGPPKTITVLQVSRQRNSSEGQAITAISSDWDTIRFRYFTEDLRIPDRYCDYEGKTVIDPLDGIPQPCKAVDVLTPAREKEILSVIVPGAIKLHVDRLLVQRIRGTVVVPKFDTICKFFTVPGEHRSVGVDNADMIFYIAATVLQVPQVAWSLSCAVLSTGRPVVGALAVSPRAADDSARAIRVFAHEIGHMLGFNRRLSAMSSRVSRIEGPRGKPSTYILKGSNTVSKTREHYNCPSLDGMELETTDSIERWEALSHWKRRNAKDELMTYEMGEGFYTALTMAAMEDTGFFKAIWGMEEPMRWGRGAGCSFVNDKCMRNNITLYPDAFCAERKDTLTCTTDGRALGTCDFRLHPDGLEDYHIYFTIRNIAGSRRTMDYCPYIKSEVNTGCRNGAQGVMLGSRISPQSRCVKGNLLVLNGQLIGDVCVQMSCRREKLRLRYLGDDKWYTCPQGGGTITPKKTFTSGHIICPSREDVCSKLGNELDELPPPPNDGGAKPPSPNKWDLSHSRDLSLSFSPLLPSVFLALVISVLTLS